MGIFSIFRDIRDLRRDIEALHNYRHKDKNRALESLKSAEIAISEQRAKLDLLLDLQRIQDPQVSVSQSKNPILRQISIPGKKPVKRIDGLVVDEIMHLEGKGLAQMKKIIVDEKNICSKASFYRIVSSLETKGLIQRDKTKSM